jgi:hypothetical protein
MIDSPAAILLRTVSVFYFPGNYRLIALTAQEGIYAGSTGLRSLRAAVWAASPQVNSSNRFIGRSKVRQPTKANHLVGFFRAKYRHIGAHAAVTL